MTPVGKTLGTGWGHFTPEAYQGVPIMGKDKMNQVENSCITGRKQFHCCKSQVILLRPKMFLPLLCCAEAVSH